MKKTAAVIAAAFAFCLLLALNVFASRSDFTIMAGGVLSDYYGPAGDVVVPGDVSTIRANVFMAGSASSVTIMNIHCTFEPGAIDPSITMYVFPNSTAQDYAEANGINYIQIYDAPKVTVRVSYVYTDGSTAAPAYSGEYPVYSSYSVKSPTVANATPDFASVEGGVEDSDVTVVVTYTKSADPIPTGWKIEGNSIRFYDSSAGGYLTSTTKNIDGVERSFDWNGNLVGSGTTVTVNGSTYYLIDNGICYGYVRMGDGIYFFDADGKMVKGQTVNGNTYDAEGRLTASKQLLELSGSTYYLDGNSLYSGYLMIGDEIFCFGDDYAMKVGVTYDQCTFDASGHLSSVNVDQLECTYDETRTYNKQEQKPPVEVFFRGMKLTENVHYSVEYADNVGPGDGKIIVTGKGAIKGSSEYTFEIVGKETFTLTVRYQNSRGYEMHEPYTEELEGGAHYSVQSPEIKGYKPDKETVEGSIADEDVTVIVTYTSEKESEKETESDTEETEPAETEPEKESEKETESETKEPGEQKTRLTYSYNFKLFFTVAGIATLVVAVIIFLIVWLGRRRRNPPPGEDPDEWDDDTDDPDGPDGPDGGAAAVPTDGSGETEELDKTKTIKFDLHEIDLEDFDESRKSSDFVDLYEFSIGDAPASPKPGTPKRYKFRTK